MDRVADDAQWSLFDPADVPTLLDVFGEDFEIEYTRLEQLGKAIIEIPARELWHNILSLQIETGCPFILYADTINGTSTHT